MRHRLIPALFAVGLWIGCEGGLFSVIVREEDQVVVPAGSILEQLLGDLGFESFLDMDVTTAEELENRGVEPGDVHDVHLQSFVLTRIAPTLADLSFLDRMEVFVSAPGLPEVLVASADDFPGGTVLVHFTLEDVDLTPYVVSRSMTLSADITGHRPEEDTTVAASIELAVGVTGQGACHQVQNDSGK